VIRQAALYFATPDDVQAARLPVIGRPLAFHVILAAVRAGARRVALPAALRSPDLDAALATSPGARAAVAWLDAPGALADEPTLLLPAAALTPAPALARLLAAGIGHGLAESLATDTPAFAADRALLAALRPALVAGAPLGDTLGRALKARELTSVAGDRWFVRVSGLRTAADAEARLWRELGSAIDSGLDVAVHRRLSRWVTRAAVALGVTPNAITVASGVVGLAAAAAFARGEAGAAVAGLLLYLVAVVLDHADGEVARLTLRDSAVGEWLDVVIDTTVHAALVLALGVASARVAGVGLLAGGVAVAGVVASATVGKLWPPVPATVAGRSLLDRLSSRDGFYAMLLVFITLMVAAPASLPTLMGVVAAGTHAYWVARALSLLRKTWRTPK
jgi:phosphatidylglycerophosphate synthase